VTKRTSLYRHFDAAGRLLYVGISLSAIYRLAQHHSGSRWAHKIATVTHKLFRTREEAIVAERKAIATENPVYNIQRYAPMERRKARTPTIPMVTVSTPTEHEVDLTPFEAPGMDMWFHSPRRLHLFAEGKLTPLDRKKWEAGGYGPYPWGVPSSASSVQAVPNLCADEGRPIPAPAGNAPALPKDACRP